MLHEAAAMIKPAIERGLGEILVQVEGYSIWEDEGVKCAWVSCQSDGQVHRVGLNYHAHGDGDKQHEGAQGMYAKASIADLKRVPGLFSLLDGLGLFDGINLKRTKKLYLHRVVAALGENRPIPYIKGAEARANNVVHHTRGRLYENSHRFLEVQTEEDHDALHGILGTWAFLTDLTSDAVSDTTATVKGPSFVAPSYLPKSGVEGPSSGACAPSVTSVKLAVFCDFAEREITPPPHPAWGRENNHPQGVYLRPGLITGDAADEWLNAPMMISDVDLLQWPLRAQHTRQKRQIRVFQAFARAFMRHENAWNDPKARAACPEWQRLQELAPGWEDVFPIKRHVYQRLLGVSGKRGVIRFDADGPGTLGFIEMPDASPRPSRLCTLPHYRPATIDRNDGHAGSC